MSGQGGQVSGWGIYTVTGEERHVRLILALLVLTGGVFVLAIFLFEVVDFSSWIEVFRRGFA